MSSFATTTATTSTLPNFVFTGKDDALGASLVNILEILCGDRKMGFCHPFFLFAAFNILGKEELIPISECIVELAKYRNIRTIFRM
jgi:hypothetical protein